MSTGAMWYYIETICDKLKRAANAVPGILSAVWPVWHGWNVSRGTETPAGESSRLASTAIVDALDSAMFPIHKTPRPLWGTTATTLAPPRQWITVAPLTFTAAHTPGQAPEVQRQ
jgi:hypothetical protein